MKKIEHIDMITELHHIIDISQLKKARQLAQQDLKHMTTLKNNVMEDLSKHLRANFSFKTFDDSYDLWERTGNKQTVILSYIDTILS